MKTKEELYFRNAAEWREWLHENHHISTGVELIFYRVSSEFESMRWEEAVQITSLQYPAFFSLFNPFIYKA